MLALSAIVAVAGADEVVVLVCSPNFGDPSFPQVYAVSCDKSAGVSVACTPQFTGIPGEPVGACAPALAAFLSLNGFKLVSTQPGQLGEIYTIVGPTRRH